MATETNVSSLRLFKLTVTFCEMRIIIKISSLNTPPPKKIHIPFSLAEREDSLKIFKYLQETLL